MKSLILLIVTIWLLILNEEAYLTNKEIHLQNEFNHNPFGICLHTGIPNRINTHKVPGINTGYLPHHPTQK